MIFKSKPQLTESSQYIIDLKEMYALRRQAESLNNKIEVQNLTNTIVIMEVVLHRMIDKQGKA